MSSNLPAIRQQQSLAVPDDEMQRLLKQAEIYVKSGIAPSNVNNPQKAVVIALQGRELGLPMMAALQNIYPIKGNAMLSAKLTEAILQRAGYRIIPLTVTAERAKGKFISPAGDEFTYEVTYEEAVAGRWNVQWDDEKKQYVEKPAWRNRKVMLWNRFITQGSKMFASEALLFPPVDEDDSMMVYDEADAEFMTAEEAERREAQRARDMAPIAAPRNSSKTLFKEEGRPVFQKLTMPPKPAPAPEPEEEPIEAEFHEPEPEQEKPHWIDVPELRNAFWPFVTGRDPKKGQLGLSKQAVYDALQVDSIHQYPGSYDQAIAAVKAHAAKLQAQAAGAKAAQKEML